MSEGRAAGNVVEVANLVVRYPVRSAFLQRVKGYVQAVSNVSFAIKKGETVGLVGEFRLRQKHGWARNFRARPHRRGNGGPLRPGG